jgi:hypothetical protein
MEDILAKLRLIVFTGPRLEVHIRYLDPWPIFMNRDDQNREPI